MDVVRRSFRRDERAVDAMIGADGKSRCVECPSVNVCAPHSMGFVGAADAPCSPTIIKLRAGEVLRAADHPNEVLVCRSGWLARFVLLPNGRRQLTDLALSGEFASFGDLAGQRSAPLVALTAVEMCSLERECFLAHFNGDAEVVQALWRTYAVEVSRLHDLVAALGQQSARARFAAFVCGLMKRLEGTGFAATAVIPFPFRQQDLADFLGLTQVHVSRVLRDLTEGALIRINQQSLTIIDISGIQRLARQ